MSDFLVCGHFPSTSREEARILSSQLNAILKSDYKHNIFTTLASYHRILTDSQQQVNWPIVQQKLKTLFKCGKAVPLDGPMLGIPLSIQDSEPIKENISPSPMPLPVLANIELMTAAWNVTFSNNGLWIGKTCEPVSKQQVAKICEKDGSVLAAFSIDNTRIGRNFFRESPQTPTISGIGMVVLTQLWNLVDRPMSSNVNGFYGKLLESYLLKEKVIPYSRTGCIFLADMGRSVSPEMQAKTVYQLNYRWDTLHPVFPMSKLIEEVVQIADGVYLGQVLFATRNFSWGVTESQLTLDEQKVPTGKAYSPKKKINFWVHLGSRMIGKSINENIDYGYQHKGYFLLVDPFYAKQVYQDEIFPQLRPQEGEIGWKELNYGFDTPRVNGSIGHNDMDWNNGWKHHAGLYEKFTTLFTESSPKETDLVNIECMRHKNESILQMIKRISDNISSQTQQEKHLFRFEKLNQLFRCGVAPRVENGTFRGGGKKGYNTNFESSIFKYWNGEKEPLSGFNYYHGTPLNLHWGFNKKETNTYTDDTFLFPSVVAALVEGHSIHNLNVTNIVWRAIGKYLFPWAGKSFEKISGRTLSMLLDESDDLEKRYPQRVKKIKNYLASAPYYDIIKKSRNHYWSDYGKFASHLESGPWDEGMSERDKAFWQNEASERWVWGNTIYSNRVLAMDAIMRLADLNYREPDAAIQALANAGPSPFVRQGCCFLGAADQNSVLPANNGEVQKKKVFQIQYRYPMLGGPVPVNYCIEEIVEIADGLFLGQLIYATALDIPFHSTVDPAQYDYQLFGYFLLMDDDWERHRQAIKLNARRKETYHKQENLLSYL